MSTTPQIITSTLTRQLSDQGPAGTELGATAADLVGLYGVTGVVQAAAITAPAATGATSSSPFGYVGAAQADAIVTAVRAMITALKNIGITA
jgi:hypothetical protein